MSRIDLLLDSEAVVWFALGTADMPRHVVDRIVADGAYISILTPIELAVKERKHHFSFGIDYDALFERALTPLPLGFSALSHFKSLPLIHKDPFDRLLIAQAIGEGLTLVTCDKKMHHYDVTTFW